MTDQLKYFRMSKKLNDDNAEELRHRRLHFRGNIDSFSLISLAKAAPERGISQLRTEEAGQEALDIRIDKRLGKIVDIKTNTPEKTRPTREKELQAWIVNCAMNHGHKLPFGDDIEFLTSELAITRARDGRRIVNDILGIDGENNLVVIELKSERAKTELEQQIKEFSDVIEEKEGFFKGIVELLARRKYSGRTKGMVVWPYAKTSPLQWEHGIAEVCYREKGKPRVIDYDEAGNVKLHRFVNGEAFPIKAIASKMPPKPSDVG